MRQNLRRDDFKRIQRRAGEPKKSNLQRDAETVQRASMSPYRVKLILGEREELRNLQGTQSFRKTLSAQIGSMIHRHDSILLEHGLHIPGKRSKTINPRKSAIFLAHFPNYGAIPTTCLAALFVPRSREPPNAQFMFAHQNRKIYVFAPARVARSKVQSTSSRMTVTRPSMNEGLPPYSIFAATLLRLRCSFS